MDEFLKINLFKIQNDGMNVRYVRARKNVIKMQIRKNTSLHQMYDSNVIIRKSNIFSGFSCEKNADIQHINFR